LEVLDSTHVQAALDSLGIEVQVMEFETSTATAEQAAASIGTELGSIVKSIVFMINKEQPVVVLVAGDQQADDRKLAAIYDVGRKKVKIAKPDECIAYVGYEPGGVPPVGHRHAVPVYIDQSLSRFETVYAAAGSPHQIFPIPFATLIEVTQGSVIDVTRD
jgi:Cys-tRNA(Pro) deacylase